MSFVGRRICGLRTGAAAARRPPPPIHNPPIASSGNDLVSGGFGDDVVFGGAGRDSLWGGEAGLSVVPCSIRCVRSSAHHVLCAAPGSAAAAALTSRRAAPRAGENNNVANYIPLLIINAQAGVNGLTGGDLSNNADVLVGGPDSDTYNVLSASDVVVEFDGLGEGDRDSIFTSGISYTMPANVELLGSLGGGAVTLTGSAGALRAPRAGCTAHLPSHLPRVCHSRDRNSPPHQPHRQQRNLRERCGQHAGRSRWQRHTFWQLWGGCS